ncbi:MAG TPA: YciI family protein [Moraxellaceae bacterium]
MRVMILIKADQQSETGALPDEKLLAAMGQYNEDLVNAGVMVGGEGLKPSSQGKRVRLTGAHPQVIDGPFPNTEELLSGFWIWQVASMDDAIAWVKRMPNPMPGTEPEIEIRPVYETEDFAESDPSGELRAQEEALRQRLAD